MYFNKKKIHQHRSKRASKIPAGAMEEMEGMINSMCDAINLLTGKNALESMEGIEKLLSLKAKWEK